MQNIRALYKLFQAFGSLRWYLPGLVALSIGVSVLEGLGLYLLAPLFETILQDEAESDWSEDPFLKQFDVILARFPEENQIQLLLICIAVAILLKCIAEYCDAVAWTWYDAAANKRIQRVLVTRLMANDPRDRGRNAGQSLNLFENQSWRAIDALMGFASALSQILAVLFFVCLLLLLSWQLSLIVLCGALIIAGIVNLLSQRIEVLGHEVVETQEQVSVKIWDILTGLKTIRIFGNEDYEIADFGRRIDATVLAGFRQERISAAVQPLVEITVALLIGLLFALSIWRDFAALPSFLTFVLILRRLMPRVQELIDARVTLSAEVAAVCNIAPLLDAPQSSARARATVDFPGLESDIDVYDLTYRHDETRQAALDGVSFTIRKGAITGVAGPSGAGKSTFVDLLCRIATPERGSIRVNGRDIADFNLDQWRHGLGVVIQDIHLFNASIRDNIAYGDMNVSDEDVVVAAKLANAHDFIVAQADGYERIISDNGSGLSGGQRQRLALARALLRKPSLLILDEVTSALDPLAETMVQEALFSRPHGATVIVIAHRATTLKVADHIVLLENGRVVQSGDWRDLSQQPGLFARMFPI